LHLPFYVFFNYWVWVMGELADFEENNWYLLVIWVFPLCQHYY